MPAPVAAIIGIVGCVVCCLCTLGAVAAKKPRDPQQEPQFQNQMPNRGPCAAEMGMYMAQQQRIYELENFIRRKTIETAERLNMNPQVQVQVNGGSTSINAGPPPTAVPTPVGVQGAARPAGYGPAYGFQPYIPVVSPLQMPTQNAPYAGTPIHFMR